MKKDSYQISDNLKALIFERQKALHLCAVVFILLFSCFLRYYYIENTVVEQLFPADAGEYALSAVNLLHTGTYSSAPPPVIHGDALRFPGYPLFLVPFLALTDTVKIFYLSVLHCQAILSTLCILLLYLIIRNVFPGWITLLIIFFAGFNPFLITMSGYFLSEILFTFLLLLFMLTVIKAIEKPSFARFALTGLILGLNLLVKPVLFPLPFLVLALSMFNRKIRALIPVKYLLTTIIIMTAVFSPWSVYSYRTEGSIMGSKSTALFHLAVGTYPDMRYNGGVQDYPNYDDPDWSKWSTTPASIFLHLRDEIKLHPATYLYWYTIEKPLMLWRWDITEGMGDIFLYPVKSTPYFDNVLFKLTRFISYIFHYPILLCFLAYTVMRITRPDFLKKIGFRSFLNLDIMAVTVLYFTFSHALFGPLQRLSIPFRILVYPSGIAIMIYLTAFAGKKFIKRIPATPNN
jgi:4-amino-4-deoxy-L-arabinose transferase-like glycosyltransferase